MMNDGYIGLFRKIVDSWVFTDAHVLQVFIYFLCKASTECRKVEVNGQTVGLVPGQLVSGRKHLMKRLGLTEREARKAIRELCNNKVIESRASSTINIITIVKYNDYQYLVRENVQHVEAEKVLVEKPERTLDFDKFWKLYPKKQGKLMANKAWKKIMPSETKCTEIMKGLKAAMRSEQWTKDRGKYIPMASTWLNQERWEDEYEEGVLQVGKSIKELPTEL